MAEKTVKATVLKDFLDKENRGLFLKKGEEIERSEERIKFLADEGLVKSCKVKQDKKDIEPVEVIDLTKNWQQVIADVNNCSNLDNLKVALEAENKVDKPRGSVIKALNERITELEQGE